MASSEVAPFARLGGLGDVTTALAGALAERGNEVALVVPKYLSVDRSGFRTEPIDLPLLFRVDNEERTGWIHKARLPDSDVDVYFVVNDHYFNRNGFYQEGGKDYPDNLARFTFFCRSVIELLVTGEFEAEIVHCHDWQTALIPAYLKTGVSVSGLEHAPKTVFTVHNIAYQGFFGKNQLPTTGLPWEVFTPEGIEFYGDINLLKAGFVYADHVTTVSERYAAEIMTPEQGCGMESIVVASRDRLTGILNGVSYETWNPQTDALLPARYAADDLSGKETCKARLREEMGLVREPEMPLLAALSPLEMQKGAELLSGSLEVLLFANEIQLVLVSENTSNSDRQLQELQARFPNQVGFRRGCDDSFVHLVVAGSDMLLMPAQRSSCGTTQLSSLRYGTPPILRQIGAMAEAVRDYNEAQKDGYGFIFHNPDPKDLLHAVRRALSVYRDKTAWTALMRRAMAQDYSWKATARRYENLYRRLLEETPL